MVSGCPITYKSDINFGRLCQQQRTPERDRLIASVMSEIVEAELGTAAKPSGTQRARGDQDESGGGRR
jgi:hypothetical protein